MKIKFNAKEFYNFVNMTKKAPKKSTVLRVQNVQFTGGRAEVIDLVNNAFFTLQGVELEGSNSTLLVRYEELIKQLNNFKTGDAVEVYDRDERVFVDVDGVNIYEGPAFYDDALEGYKTEELKKAPESFIYDVKKAINYCSKDSVRMNLNGVYYTFEGVNYAGTDGHRMMGRLDKNSSFGGAIISRAFIEYYDAGKMDNEVFFNIDYTTCKCGNIELTVKNIEGPYPKYQNCVPSTFEREITFKKCDILKALETLKPFTNDRTHKVITYAGNNFYLRAEDPDRGVFKEVYIDAVLNGDAAGICFDAVYMAQNIKDVEAEDITLKFNTPMTAAVFSGDGYLNLLMPVRYEDGNTEVPELNTKNSTYVKGENKPVRKAAQKKATKKATEGAEDSKPVNTEELKEKALKELKKELRSEVIEQLRKELEKEVKSALTEEMRGDVKEELKKALKAEVIQDIRINNEGAVIEALRSEYKPVITEHLKEELRPKIEKSLSKEVYNELKKAMAEKVEKEAQEAEKAMKAAEAEKKEAKELQKAIEETVKSAFCRPEETKEETPEKDLLRQIEETVSAAAEVYEKGAAEVPPKDQAPAKKRGLLDLIGDAVQKCSIAAGVVAGVISTVYVLA